MRPFLKQTSKQQKEMVFKFDDKTDTSILYEVFLLKCPQQFYDFL